MKYSSEVAIVILTVLFVPSRGHLRCLVGNSSIVDCSNKNLTSLPDDLPTNTTFLLLMNNQIKSLSPTVRRDLPALLRIDLSGNPLDCDCSLSWLKNASISLEVKGTCSNPALVIGRSLANLTVDEICVKLPVTTRISTVTFYSSDIPTTATAPSEGLTTLGKQLLTTSAVPTERSPPHSTTTELPITLTAHSPTTSSEKLTTAHSPTTSSEKLTTAHSPTTSSENLATTDFSITSSEKLVTTDFPTASSENSTTIGRSNPLPTERSNVTQDKSLADLLHMSTATDFTPKSLKNFVEAFEKNVYQRNNSDAMTMKTFLLIYSNLMKKKNTKTWTEVNKNYPGLERLLRAVGKAAKLHAVEMLRNATNVSPIFSDKYKNVELTIHVVVVGEMTGKELEFPVDRGADDDFIKISRSKLQTAGQEKVAFLVMKSQEIGELLPRQSLIDDFDSFQTSSLVLSAVVVSLNGNISLPVTIKFENKHFPEGSKEHTKCVFWKHEKRERKSAEKVSRGKTRIFESGWSDKGCVVISRNKSSTICHCGHMTDFAVITRSIEEVGKPSVVVFVAGMCLLVAALIALLRNILVWRRRRHERLSVLAHKCVAFMLIAGIFLLGIFLDYHETTCLVLAALLHWFALAVFCWILAGLVQLHLCVASGWNRNCSRLKYFAILGWIVPLVFVGIVLALTRQNSYGSNQWCWYSDSLVLLLTYVCPSSLCILVCIMVIIKILWFKTDATDESEKRDLTVILIASALLIPLVLCTFITAALSAGNPEKKVFQYVFAACCILLAVYLLIYHFFLDREIMKMSVGKKATRPRPKRDYYSTKETVMYSEGTSSGKSFSLIFPSRKSPSKKVSEKRPPKGSDSGSPFDYDSTAPMYPSLNDSSLKSFKSQVSTQQHTLETPPNTLTAITISRPNSQCVELTSFSDVDRRPDGAEQTDACEPSDFCAARHSDPLDKERQRTSGCSADCGNATTFGKKTEFQTSSDASNNNPDQKNRTSGASSGALSRTSRSSVSGSSTAPTAEHECEGNEARENDPFLCRENDRGPEIKSDPPSKIPKRRKRGSRRRLDEDFHDEESDERQEKTQSSSSLPSTESSVKHQQYTSF